MFDLAWPWFLIALPLPFVYRYFLTPSKQQLAGLWVPFFSRAQNLVETSHSRPSNKLALICLALSWSLLVLSASNPKIVGEPIEVDRSGRDLMLAVDISGSMSTADMIYDNQRFARIVVVKSILEDFLKKREGDRLGLILFGTNAYVQAPLTFDLATIRQYLQEATLRLAGEKTAIGDAIGLAIKRLKGRPDSQRVLILLTDGANTAGTAPRDTVEMAQISNVKIYTVGVASQGLRRGLFSSSGNDLDEATLRFIAEETGGQYFRARSPEELVKIYETLDEIESIEVDGVFFRPEKSVYYIPLGLSLGLFLIALFARKQSAAAV